MGSYASIAGWVVFVLGLLALAAMIFLPMYYTASKLIPALRLPRWAIAVILALGAFGLWFAIPPLVAALAG